MDSSNPVNKSQPQHTHQQSSKSSEKKLYNLNTDFSMWLRTNKEEIEAPLPGQITYGHIPSWLSGSLIRNGPGDIDAYGPGVCRHVFDAPGRLHKYQIHDGKVLYTSKFIQSRAFKGNTADKRLIFNEFGTFATRDPCQTIFSRVATMFSDSIETIFSDNANIGIFPFGDEIYSLAETPFAHRINLDNLETLNTVNVHEELGIVHHTSHPHTLDGIVYNIGQKLSLLKRPQYIIAEMDCTDDGSGPEFKNDRSRHPQSTILSPWATAKIVATVPSRWPLSMGYIHSFAVTANYFILIEQPLSIFLPDVPLNLLRREPVASALKFHSNKKTLFHVIRRNQQGFNRSSKSRQVFSVPSFFFFHTINGYETVDGDTNDISIVVDICCYDDPSIINCMYVDALKNAHTNPDYAKMIRGRPKRFTMKLSEFGKSQRGASQVAQSKLIVDIGCETPKINYESFNGKPYNYFYAISSDVDANQPGMVKLLCISSLNHVICAN
ncbi:unnamed protein product [Orchesella dallaii]|uniref:Carotenoid isomerooxygenase n=1 Tax=Orchesella dallaii TaxID=48710 RepID=A0ABP1Q4F9_9HEXA